MTYDEQGRFVGEHGSPEHKAHIARVAHEQQVHEAIEALVALNDPGEDIAARARGARDLDYIKEDAPAAYDEAMQQYNKALADLSIATLKMRARPPFNPDDSRIGDVFSSAPPQPPFVVDRLLPRAHGVENAIGGAGKTTRHIWEAVHIILGRELYGLKVHQPGAVLVVSKEDDEELFRHRIHEVVANFPGLSPEDRRRIADQLHVLILTGHAERLAIADRQGNFARTDLAERIIRGFGAEGLALVELDPFNLFSPGERYVNDGEAEALSAMAHISMELHCAVRATSHVSKAVGREGTSDAHSGRGGSAGGDNSRFVWNYWRHDPERDKGAPVPVELAGAADMGDLYRLHIAKLTAARQARERIWIVRKGFSFEWQADQLVTPQERRSAAADADAAQVLAYLRRGLEQGSHYTTTELVGEARTIGMGKDRVRAAVQRLRAQSMVGDAELPADMRQGGRKTYLEPRAPVAAEFDPAKPVFP